MTDTQLDELKTVKSILELNAFSEFYETAKFNYAQLCYSCKEWESMDLPYDCLSKPAYCLKTDRDREIINLFEEKRDELLDENQ